MPAWRTLSIPYPSYRHLAALALLEHKAFWSAAFANPAQQPIAVQPAYRDASCPAGTVLSYRNLDPPGSPAWLGEAAPCMVGWRRKFDYVLVENAGGLADPVRLLPGDLTLLRSSDIAALYRVTRRAPDP